jgi:hypothetical protein
MKEHEKEAMVLMFQRINALMEANLEKWKNIGEIRKTYDEFMSQLKKFRDLQPDLEMDLTPVKEEWERKRKILISKIFPIGNILLVYADDIGKKMDVTLGMSWGEMKGMKNKKLFKLARKICKRTQKYQPQTLENYGLTADMTGSLEQALLECDHTYRMYRDMMLNRKKTLKKSKKHFKAIRELLEKRLDKLMTVFTGTHPSFYEEYRQIRFPDPG